MGTAHLTGKLGPMQFVLAIWRPKRYVSGPTTTRLQRHAFRYNVWRWIIFNHQGHHNPMSCSTQSQMMVSSQTASTTSDKLVLFTYTMIEETKSAWYLTVRRLHIESLLLLGSKCSYFRKYNKRTLRGFALIDKITPRGQSEADFVDAEKINGPILG